MFILQGGKTSGSPHAPGLLRYRSSEEDPTSRTPESLKTPEMLTQEQRNAQVSYYSNSYYTDTDTIATFRCLVHRGSRLEKLL